MNYRVNDEAKNQDQSGPTSIGDRIWAWCKIHDPILFNISIYILIGLVIVMIIGLFMHANQNMKKRNACERICEYRKVKIIDGECWCRDEPKFIKMEKVE